MRVTLYISILTVALLFGCDRSDSTAPATDAAVETIDAAEASDTELTDSASAEPQIRYLEGPQPGDDTVLASWKDHTVTVADFDHAARIGRLFAPQTTLDNPPPPVTDRRMAMPTVHFTMTRSLMTRLVVSEAIEELGLEVSDEEALQALRDNDQLIEFIDAMGTDKLKTYLKNIGLSEADIIRVGRELAEREKLEDHLVAQLDEERIWEHYQTQNRLISVAIAHGMNVPASDELSAFVRDNPDAIEAYFEENATSFRVPGRVEIEMLALKTEGDSEDGLKKAADRLKRGEQASKVAADLGLDFKDSVYLVRQQNNEAFSGGEGSTGWTASGPGGAYAWRVKTFHASHQPELNRPLRRQVAAEMMRRSKLVGSLKSKLEEAASALKDLGYEPEPAELEKARRTIHALDLKFEVTPEFSRTPNGALPGIGLAPEVSEAAFALRESTPTSEPILSRENGYVVHLLERKEPSREAFEASRETLIDRYRKSARSTVVDRFVQSKLGPTDSTFDLRPLGIKYGVISKP